MPVRLLVADDHALMRDDLKALLAAMDDMQVVGEARDGQDAVRSFFLLQPTSSS